MLYFRQTLGSIIALATPKTLKPAEAISVTAFSYLPFYLYQDGKGQILLPVRL